MLLDRVEDTTTTTGTGSLTLAGTTFPDQITVPYIVESANKLVWEAGLGRRESTLFLRLVILSTSNNDQNHVSLPSGTSKIRLSTPSLAVLDQFPDLDLQNNAQNSPQSGQNGQPDAQNSVYFGFGTLGDVTIEDATVTLSQLGSYRTLIIGTNGILKTNGWSLEVQNAIILRDGGILSADGAPGSDASGFLGGEGAEGSSRKEGVLNALIGASGDGGDGRSTTGLGPAQSGFAGSSVGYGAGGQGGQGGTTTIAGGLGGVITNLSYPTPIACIVSAIPGGGAGGGGGSSSTSAGANQGAAGGGGGAGGQPVVIVARTIQIDATSKITAKGGKGGNGATSTGVSGGGGGGGGGGGVVIAVTNSYKGPNPDVSGGLGGTGPSGNNGSVGSDGLFRIFIGPERFT